MNAFSITSKSAIRLNAGRMITALAIGIILAILTIEATFLLITTRSPTEGWTVHYDLGRVAKPLRRALVAKVGLGALVAEEALYYSNYKDSEGRPLHGQYRYRLRFKRDQIPATHAFWSLSLYDQNHFFVKNPIDRYSLGDQSSVLRFNQDGSLDIIIAQIQDVNDLNWLPSGDDIFMLTLRAYLPADRLLTGGWLPPSIIRLDAAAEGL
jgi:hypothetical protein